MLFREWMYTIVNQTDIWARCIDPTGEDKDNNIMPLGLKCKPDNCECLTNNIMVNTKLLLYAFNISDEIGMLKHKGNRRNVKNILNKTYTMTKLKPTEYYAEIGKYKFVISPEGNGIDCYRHYETWISKGIPIIQRNPFIEKKYCGLPILWTDDYSEITDDYLEDKYTEFLDKDFDFSKILLSKYPDKIQQQIKHAIRYNHSIPETKTPPTTLATEHGFWEFDDYFKLL